MLKIKPYVCLLLITLFPPTLAFSSGSILDSFLDPKDGKFDVSNWLIERKGLPVPIITSDPAIGYGGGGSDFVWNLVGMFDYQFKDWARSFLATAGWIMTMTAAAD